MSNSDNDDVICAGSTSTVEEHHREVHAQRAAMALCTELGVADTLAAAGITEENSNLGAAMADCLERNRVYRAREEAQAEDLRQQGKEPHPCYNRVCEKWRDGNRCADGAECHGCLYQTLESPPNSLNYSEYMPTHREALDMLEQHGLLKGDRQRYLEAYHGYDKPSTDKERNATEVKGIDFFTLQRCTETALLNHARNDFVRRDCGDEFCDELAQSAKMLSNDVSLEVEKAMGIYPNLRLR